MRRSPDGWLAASDIGLTLKSAQFASAGDANAAASTGSPDSGVSQ
jgi:hypothetical protein